MAILIPFITWGSGRGLGGGSARNGSLLGQWFGKQREEVKGFQAAQAGSWMLWESRVPRRVGLGGLYRHRKWWCRWVCEAFSSESGWAGFACQLSDPLAVWP